MYVSPCASHYYRQFFRNMSEAELAAQKARLASNLAALEEEREELRTLPAGQAAKVLADAEREAVELRAKLAAVEELIAERVQSTP